MSKIELSAIDKYVQVTTPLPIEESVRGKDYIKWGNDNNYPAYLLSLYKECPTLQTLINGTVDYVVGDEVQFRDVNLQEPIEDFVKKVAFDLVVYGGFAIEVIRNLGGQVAELHHLDVSKVRSDGKGINYYYADDWSKWSVKAICLKAFDVNASEARSIYYYKKITASSVYPVPLYGAAVTACEIERSIDKFHLNSIHNGFSSNVIINLNGGIPEDEQKDEIERNINEKFAGPENAGRILVSYNDGAENATTIQRLDTDDFADRYSALVERCTSQMYQAFRGNALLFGATPTGTGFSTQEYSDTFALFNRTVVNPLQKAILRAFETILGDKPVIIPFTINFTSNAPKIDNSLTATTAKL